ncbi:MAG: T9SS type A sorting domain-containing protein [Bacteroidota bacterium]
MKYIIAITLLWLVQISNAQSVWKKFYSRPLHTSFSYQVKETYDKGYLLEAADKGLNGSYPWYGWIVKTDINGNKLWDKLMGGPNISDFTCLNVTSDGGFIVGGRYDISGDYMRDALVMKFNSCAEPEWCSFLPETNNDESIIFPAIYELPDGGYICERNKPSDFDHNRWSLIKLRPSGEVEWINYYDLNTSWMSQLDFNLNLTSDTCFLVTSLVWDSVNTEGLIRQMPLWYKVGQGGNLLWEREWKLTQERTPAEARVTIEDKHGNYYTGGMMLQPLGYSFLYKLSHDGDTIASYRINDNPGTVVSLVHTLNYIDDTTFLTGTQYVIDNDSYWSINKTDTLGNIKKQVYEKEKVLFTNSLITSDNKILTLGVSFVDYPAYPDMVALYKFNSNLEYDNIYTLPRTYDSLCPHPIVSDTIPMPGICHYVSLPELEHAADVIQLKIYPNPASQYTTVEIPEYSVNVTNSTYISQQQFRPLNGEVQLQFINMQGQKMLEKVFDASERNQVLYIEHLVPGMYMLQLTQKGKVVAQGKMMVGR